MPKSIWLKASLPPQLPSSSPPWKQPIWMNEWINEWVNKWVNDCTHFLVVFCFCLKYFPNGILKKYTNFLIKKEEEEKRKWKREGRGRERGIQYLTSNFLFLAHGVFEKCRLISGFSRHTSKRKAHPSLESSQTLWFGRDR